MFNEKNKKLNNKIIILDVYSGHVNQVKYF